MWEDKGGLPLPNDVILITTSHREMGKEIFVKKKTSDMSLTV